MESKLMFLVVCVICCGVSCIRAEDNLSTPTNLTSKITHNECGKTKYCLDNPKGCDPSGSSQCYFSSVTLSNNIFVVELSGNSIGYIALAAGVTSNVFQGAECAHYDTFTGSHFIFVCGNNNGVFFFRTATVYNNTLGITNTPNVHSIQGSIQTSLIQCIFSIPIDGNSSNTANSIFLDILKGSTNGTALGATTSVLESSVLVNLANSTNVESTTASTTAGTTASTTASTTANTTAGTTARTTANTTAGTTASTTANTTAGTTANTTAGTTANTTAGTTANTTAGTTAGTTASTTASTTARTTAKSNASISFISLLSHAAICLLSIFLHLI